MAFPRLNNVSFWCASLRLLYGYFTLIELKVLTNFGMIYQANIGKVIVAQRLSKTRNLPNSEIDRGQEHVTKVENALTMYNSLQVKVSMDECPYSACESETTTLLYECNNSLNKSDQSLFNCAELWEPNKIGLGIQPKETQTIKRTTTRFPKWGDPYGDGVSIVGLGKLSSPITKVRQVTRTYSTKAVIADKQLSEFSDGREWLSQLKKRNDGRYSGIYKLIQSKELITLAYSEIKSNPGNLTPGNDKVTLDGFSSNLVEKLTKELQTEKFKFTSVKRVFIPKKNGKLRPLGIPNIHDKIVQRAMAIILTYIYEPHFSDISHGFRPNRSTHTALNNVSKWNGINWLIEGDIKGFFDNINHVKLVELLSRKIDDQQFIDLVWKLLRAGYLEDGQFKPSDLGVPQGGIVSPILSNIYLDEFDKFIEKFIDSNSSKDKLISKVNPEMVRFSKKLKELESAYAENKDRSILREIRLLRLNRNKVPSRIRTGIRIRYVRYADDWLIGIVGPKSLAINIKNIVKDFLKVELLLDLSDEKTLITNPYKRKAKFLGVYIYILRRSVSPMVISKIIRGKTRYSRINNVRIHFDMPTKEIKLMLIDKGFILEKVVDGKKKLIPFAITKWIFLDHRAIILRYNSVIEGLFNYYYFVDNIADFWDIQYFIHHSCAKTLARKLNLRSRAKVFKKFGKALTSKAEENTKQKDMSFKLKNSFKVAKNGIRGNIPLKYNPFETLDWSLRTQINLFDPCWICGATENIEVHHVKHLRKDGKKPTGFLSLMSQLNRKQIPLCIPCHNKVHNGTYNGLKLKDLKRPGSKTYIILPKVSE